MLKLGKKVDARGYSCPQPVLIAKKALEENSSGIEVLVDNNTACMNVKRYMENAGYNVSIEKFEDDDFIVTGTK